jgi:16S rRNA G527 N7-methylase RsmG
MSHRDDAIKYLRQADRSIKNANDLAVEGEVNQAAGVITAQVATARAVAALAAAVLDISETIKDSAADQG